MAKITSNRLLLISVFALLVYWGTSSILPNPYLTIANNALLFTASGFGLWRYREKTFDILLRGERVPEGEKGYGGYLAVYGIFLVFMGSFYGALYSSVWIYMGQPPHWLGTSYAQFGRFLTVCGFVCMASSPDITREGFVLPERLWAVAIVLVALFSAGFYLGTKSDERSSAVPGCPQGWVVGTARKTYHTDDSPYRKLISPRICFATVEDAEKAGFRPPRGSKPAG